MPIVRIGLDACYPEKPDDTSQRESSHGTMFEAHTDATMTPAVVGI